MAQALLLKEEMTLQDKTIHTEQDAHETAAGDESGDLESERPAATEDLPTTLARVEREIIIVALRASRGNKAGAARALGISERLMGLRVKKYRINPRSFRTNR